jgi:hypothetical protein
LPDRAEFDEDRPTVPDMREERTAAGDDAVPSPNRGGRPMRRVPRIVAIFSIVAGAILVVAGGVTYYLVHRELADEHIVVSEDAEHNAGEKVEGPFTAYSEAMVIKSHALEAGGGLTYAQLPQDDPRRETVMTASFLRASLFTSVVAFGVAALVVGLGVLFVLVGLALLGIVGRLDRVDHPAAAEPPVVAPAA